MDQKTNGVITINEKNPKILNDYLEAVRDDSKERINSTSEVLSNYIIQKVKKAI